MRRFAAAVAWLFLTSACVPRIGANKSHDPNAPLPDNYEPAIRPDASGDPPRDDGPQSRGGAPPSDPAGTIPEATPLTAAENSGITDWHTYFKSPQLRALIDEALENNQEVNAQLQELVIAKAEIRARGGELFPKASVGGGVGLEKPGRDTSQGAADELTGVPDPLGNYQFGLNASWEIDVWGKLRGAKKAAISRYKASVEVRRFMLTQLVAEIARSYYELLALDAQLDILDRNIAIQQDALEIVKQEKTAARATELAVQRFKAEVLKNRARVFQLRMQRTLVENRINFLVGRTPRPIPRDPAALTEDLPEILRVGVPSELLQNRPDIRRAEQEIQAAKFDLKVARASFYPSLSVDAGLGYRSFNLVRLLATPDALAFNVGAGLSMPLLNRRALKARYQTANAQQIEAVYMYERAVIEAFTEVANQLATFDNLRQSYELGAQQVASLQESVSISLVLFQSARADYMEVLLTRRDALEAELDLLETRLMLWQSTVSLYQALGGGWVGTHGDPSPDPGKRPPRRKGRRTAANDAGTLPPSARPATATPPADRTASADTPGP